MLYGDAPTHEPQQAQQQVGEFIRGPLPPPPMMRLASVSSSNMPLPPDYQHKHVPPPYDVHGDNFAARRMRKLTQRRAVDYTSTVVRYMQVCMWQRDSRDRTVLQPTRAASIDMLPSIGHSDNPSTSFAAKFVHASLNKNRCSINRVLWTPTGRRLITGSQSGEFTLWNGQSFNFEMLIQAHDQAVRSMIWSHNENWMVTGDDGGSIKYWQNNLNNVKANKSAHKESVRDLSFCKTDLKFCSCSDDTTVKVWDFARCQEERSLSGHGWDVKSVDWHPTKSLLASGGKDSLVKFWDAKSGKELSSFHGHKNIVLSVKWNQNGNWLLTASKDQVIKLYEIRTMKELESFRGHQRDVTALAWHPFHEEYFVSGSFDGSILHWLVGHEMPQVEMTNAHDNSVWDLSWHPIGYLLCSGSHDNTTKFWCRNRPGESSQDKINVGHTQIFGDQNTSLSSRLPVNFQLPDIPVAPGLFSVGAPRNEGTIPGVGIAVPLTIPSLDTPAQAETVLPFPSSMPAGAPPLPPGPHPSLLSGSHSQQQHQNLPQQVSSNLQHLQPPSHMPLLPHPQHVPRLSFQAPQPLPGSLSISSMPMPSILGTANQMGPTVGQGHFVGINQVPSGSLSGSGMPPPSGSHTNGFPNVHGPVKQGSPQVHPHGGGFGRGTAGLMPLLPGLGHFQPSDRHGTSGIGLPPGAPPLPPGPHPQLRRPQ